LTRSSAHEKVAWLATTILLARPSLNRTQVSKPNLTAKFKKFQFPQKVTWKKLVPLTQRRKDCNNALKRRKQMLSTMIKPGTPYEGGATHMWKTPYFTYTFCSKFPSLVVHFFIQNIHTTTIHHHNIQLMMKLWAN